MTSKRSRPAKNPTPSRDLSGLGGERLRPESAGQADTDAQEGASAAAPSPTSRARIRPELDSTVAERVGWCIHLMTIPDGWNGYLTRAELAMVWEVSDVTVRHYAAEASRTLALDEEGREQAKLGHATALLAMSRRAENTHNMLTGMPDFASAIKARETAAKFQGIVLATGLEMTGKNGGAIALSLDDIDAARKAVEANECSPPEPSTTIAPDSSREPLGD